MKIIRYVLIVYSLLLSFTGFSQTESEKLAIIKQTNVAKLKALSKEFRDRYRANREEALRLAKKNGWKAEIAESKWKKLVGVSEDGRPIYREPLDDGAKITARSPALYSGGSLGLALQGEGITAGVWDVFGIMTTHYAFENRVRHADTAKASVFDTTKHQIVTKHNNHATGVAGNIIASSLFNSAAAYGIAGGVAFKGNVDGYDDDYDLAEMTNAAANGLLLSNHSYVGNQYNSGYFGFERDLDQIMYNAPFYLSVWACGNTGGPIDQLSSSSASKNGIGVANSWEVLNYTGPSSVQIYAGNGTVASEPSSFGPSDDYRIKPDITANGYRTRILSVAKQGFENRNGYTNGGGTSMAAPVVTGGLMLLQQHYNNLEGKFMRSSTAKGVILHTADESGPNPGPDITFGWGLLNLEKAANTITENKSKSLILEDSLGNGAIFSREFIASGTEPLVATVCWTDVPGTASLLPDNDRTPKLVNNLDLRISYNGTTFFPWKLDSTNLTGAAIQGDNNRDNVEKIEIPAPVAGQSYTLAISHKGSLTGNGQRFSLIVSGLEECVANRSISSAVNYASIDQQQASVTLTAQNTINNGAKAIYHAADEVLLKDGFTSIAGSEVRAYLEGCSNDYAARMAVVERSVVTYPQQGSIEDAELPENSVYPNPGTGIFKVNLGGIVSGEVEITELNGAKIFSKHFEKEKEMEVNIKTSPPGIYLVRVVSANKVLTKKILKK